MTKGQKETKTVEKQDIKFSKEQIVNSAWFSYIEKDVLKSLLSEDEKYTLEDIKKVISDFKKKAVR